MNEVDIGSGNCYICHSDKIDFLYNAIEGYSGEAKVHSYMICSNCGLVFIYPRPSPEYLSFIYENGYHPVFDTTRKNLRRKIKEAVYAYHLKKSTGENLFLKYIFNFLKDYFILPPFSTSGKRILDVGCGNGNFLQLFKQNDWETFGTETSGTSASYAENLGNKIFYGDLIDAHYPRNYFDLIVVNNVLEHVFDPRIILGECYNVISNNGALVICVPNYACFDSRMLKNEWNGIHSPCHLFLFNKKNLEKLLNECGFSVEKVQFNPTLQSILRQYRFNNYLKSIFINAYINEKHLQGNVLKISFSLFKIFITMFLYKPLCLITSRKRSEQFSQEVIVYAKKINN